MAGRADAAEVEVDGEGGELEKLRRRRLGDALRGVLSPLEVEALAWGSIVVLGGRDDRRVAAAERALSEIRAVARGLSPRPRPGEPGFL